jgi:3-oxoacyl-(acyl-carrier-protein) synthase
MPDRPLIAIAGCGAISAVGPDVTALRSALRANASGLRACERFNGPRYQSNIVGAAPENGGGPGADDPIWRLANEAIEQARREAAQVLAAISPSRIGLVLSTTKANIEALERLTDHCPCSWTARRHLQADLLAADLAAAHGAGGVVQCISVACVSGLVALMQGARLIERGAADAVIVVGADHLSAFVMAGFSALKALDPFGCRPFDRNRCGLSPGEAGAAIVLARQELGDEHAGAPMITISGWGTSNDANHLTGPSRDGSGLALAIRRALDSAGLLSEQVHYINAHGTGTPYNDAMESLALCAIFGDACPPVSASKGMFGHTLGAAGVLETIVCLLAMQEQLLPGTPRLCTPAEGTPASLVQQTRAATRMRHVLKLNTGFGGVNGALVLSLRQSRIS